GGEGGGEGGRGGGGRGWWGGIRGQGEGESSRTLAILGREDADDCGHRAVGLGAGLAGGDAGGAVPTSTEPAWAEPDRLEMASLTETLGLGGTPTPALLAAKRATCVASRPARDGR